MLMCSATREATTEVLYPSSHCLQVDSYQVVYWPSVPVGTNKDAVLVWKPIDKTANESGKLVGRNGDKATKARINFTDVDFCYMVQKVAELGVSQPQRQLKTVISTSPLYTVCVH